MNDIAVKAVVGAVALIVPCAAVPGWLGDAGKRYGRTGRSAVEQTPARSPWHAMAEDQYCTPQLKAIVRRVAGACGLLGGSGEGGRGCQPQTAQSVASLSGEDFNALFLPLSKRAHIIQFDAENTELDDLGKSEVERAWADQRGASFFFVVSRASTDGDAKKNEELSANRAQSVLTHLDDKFNDPDLKNEVGLLWLGEQYAQLGAEFCGWKRSRSTSPRRRAPRKRSTAAPSSPGSTVRSERAVDRARRGALLGLAACSGGNDPAPCPRRRSRGPS